MIDDGQQETVYSIHMKQQRESPIEKHHCYIAVDKQKYPQRTIKFTVHLYRMLLKKVNIIFYIFNTVC